MGRAFLWLVTARLCQIIPHGGANGVPLAAEANHRIRKAALLDVGLVHGPWNTPAGRRFPRWEALSPPVRGGLTEQVAAQQLRGAPGHPGGKGSDTHTATVVDMEDCLEQHQLPLQCQLLVALPSSRRLPLSGFRVYLGQGGSLRAVISPRGSDQHR